MVFNYIQFGFPNFGPTSAVSLKHNGICRSNNELFHHFIRVCLKIEGQNLTTPLNPMVYHHFPCECDLGGIPFDTIRPIMVLEYSPNY